MSEKGAPPDLEIARLTRGQHGVVTTRQLHAAGVSPNAISARVRRGQLHRVHQGVYVVGHDPISNEARWMAAVRACGDGAVLSHGSAAALWGLLRPIDGPIDVSVPTHTGRKRRKGICIHRCASLAVASLVPRRSDAGDKDSIPASTRREGIPVTAPWRTIEDLRGTVAPKLYRRAVREAELRRFALSPATLRDRTRSDVEGDFLTLCRRHGLPLPGVNVKIGRWTVDFVWPAQRLAVEADSWATHGASTAFEDDHVRDLDLRRRGLTVYRYTERQIRREPELVVADLREHFAGRGEARHPVAQAPSEPQPQRGRTEGARP